MICKYQREFNTNSLLDVELWAFKTKLSVEQGGLGRTTHFINICKEIWPKFEWHEWALKMAEALCENDITGFTSGASSGKSEILAKFALVIWFCDPVHTLVIACSTTASDARQKIWGHIVRNFHEARAEKKSVGKLIDTQAIIKLSEKSDGVAASDNSSICLVAAGNEFKEDSLKRLQGRHQKNVILILDELQDCSQEIITTALGNLSANEHFEVHVAGNASSRYDAHGVFMQPVDGWNSINRYTGSWKIKVGGKEGLGLHFDCTSEDAPNIKRASEGKPQISFLRKIEEVLVWKGTLGENNATFLRQFVGFWPDSESETDYLYTEHSITTHKADERPVWKNPPTDFGGIDPSFTSGGDRFMFHHLRYGQTDQDEWVIESKESISVKPIPLKGETKDAAAVRMCKKIAEDRNIHPRNVGVDASAGGAILSIFHQNWSPEIFGVQFGGSATDLPVSSFDKRLGSERFSNAVSELWGIGVEFLNAGQLRGLRPSLIKELISRKFKKVAGDKIQVEKKDDMKKRLGFSPDEADSYFVGIRVIRERLKIIAGGQTVVAKSQSNDWNRLKNRRDVVSRTAATMQTLIKNRLG